MSDSIPDDFMKLAGSKGGRARAQALSKTERSEIARKAAKARWQAPVAEFTGKLRIGERELDCAVLDGGTRLISQGDIMRALGRAESMGRRSDAAPFLSAANLQGYITADLRGELTPVAYRLPNSQFTITGYPAAVLPAVCEIYLAAREDKVLAPRQHAAAHAAEVLMRGLARVGINALVDEATGYQAVRDRDELQKLLASYVNEEFRPWVQRFPNEFFSQIYRIYALDEPQGNRRPQFIGRFINEYIYEGLPEGVLEDLRRVNPSNAAGNRARRHHQHLTEHTGNTHLDRQITTVITLMSISANKHEFKALYAKRFPPKRDRVLTVTPVEGGAPMVQLELELPES
ncbi:P63C domain-containing protein [Brachybacterium sp. DNPG3]